MDIDFITDLSEGFSISIGDNPQGVTGNRALLNRFEITFLTKSRRYLLNNNIIIVDNFAGDAEKFINRPQVLNDPQSIAAAISIAIDQTVESIKRDEPSGTPNTEKLDRAELIDINIENGLVYANIQVFPIETETYESLMFNLPIIRKG